MEVMVVLLSGFSSEPLSVQITSGGGSPIKSISTCKTVPARMNRSFNGVFIFGFTVENILSVHCAVNNCVKFIKVAYDICYLQRLDLKDH